MLEASRLRVLPRKPWKVCPGSQSGAPPFRTLPPSPQGERCVVHATSDWLLLYSLLVMLGGIVATQLL